MKRPNLYIPIGLPASGKSTWAENKKNVVVVSSDKIRKELYGDEAVQQDPEKVFKIVFSRVKENLLKEKSVVLDATNISIKNRANIFKQFKQLNVNIVAVYFSTSYEDCLERNLLRERKVPENVITSMYKRLEIPEYTEGWDEIRIINNDTYYNPKIYSSKNISWVFEAIYSNLYPIHEDLLYNNEIFQDIYGVEHENPHHTHTISKHSWKVYKYCRDHANFLMSCDNEIVAIAAIFHDCGKGFCKQWNDEKGHYVFYGHDKVGAQKAINVLSHYLSNKECLIIANLIGNHMLIWQNETLAETRVAENIGLLRFLHTADIEGK